MQTKMKRAEKIKVTGPRGDGDRIVPGEGAKVAHRICEVATSSRTVELVWQDADKFARKTFDRRDKVRVKA